MTDMLPPPDMGDFEITAKAALEKLEDTARKLGLYLDRAQGMISPHGELVLVAEFLLGDVAFSDRTQDPDKKHSDDIVGAMEKSIAYDEFLETRERLKQQLAEGKNPLDEI